MLLRLAATHFRRCTVCNDGSLYLVIGYIAVSDVDAKETLVHVYAIRRFIFGQVWFQSELSAKLVEMPLFLAWPRVQQPARALRLWHLSATSMYLPLETCLRVTRVRGVNCLHVKCLPPRRFCKTAAHCTQHGPPLARSSEIEEKSISGMRAVAFVAVLSFTLAPGKAQAWGHDWKPRRHHRRMTDSRAAVDVKSVFQVPFPALRMHCQNCFSCSFVF